MLEFHLSICIVALDLVIDLKQRGFEKVNFFVLAPIDNVRKILCAGISVDVGYRLRPFEKKNKDIRSVR